MPTKRMPVCGHLVGTGCPPYRDGLAAHLPVARLRRVFAAANAQAAMGVLADAVADHDPRARNLWFDVASIVDRDIAPATAALVTA